MRDLREVRLEAFRAELEKLADPWYARAGRSVANFGKRQLHGFTGYTPHGMANVEAEKGLKWLEGVGGGAASSRERLAKAEQAVGKSVSKSNLTEVERAKRAVEANEKAQQMGLTSIPGYARSLKQHGVGKTLKAGFEQQWHGSSPTDKALMVGLPLGLTAASALAPDDPNNPHKARDIGAGLAGTAVGAVTGTLPFAAGMAASELASAAGRRAGGLFARKPAARVLPPSNPEEAPGQHVPTERVMSPYAAGQMPEVT